MKIGRTRGHNARPRAQGNLDFYACPKHLLWDPAYRESQRSQGGMGKAVQRDIKVKMKIENCFNRKDSKARTESSGHGRKLVPQEAC